MVMESLLRLRMFCNNGPVEAASRSQFSALQPSAHPDETLSFLQQSGEAICAFCSVDIFSIGTSPGSDIGSLTPCGRLVCGECILQYNSRETQGKPFVCSLCDAEHSVVNVYEDDLSSQEPSKKHWPSKIVAVVQDVQTHYLRSKW